MSERWDLRESFPVFPSAASGGRVWDHEGRVFIDLSSASGTLLLGYGHPAIEDALVAEYRRTGGIGPGRLSTLRVVLAERLLKRFAFPACVLFFRTGSCGTTAAVRLAQAYSGRDLILTSGYHGWHDWYVDRSKPDAVAVDFGYDLDLLDRTLERLAERVACVIVTPEVNLFPDEYWRELVALVHARKTLVVLDEVITGLRFGRAGVTGALNLDPDAVVLSKGLANGTALSAVVARPELIAAGDRVALGSTYQRETIPFAVALAADSLLADGSALATLFARGTSLIEGLNGAFAEFGVRALATGVPSMFEIVFHDEGEGRAFYEGWRDDGILAEFRGKHMLSAGHTERDVDRAVDAARGSLRRLASTNGGAAYLGDPVGVEALQRHAAATVGATASSVRRWTPLQVRALRREAPASGRGGRSAAGVPTDLGV